MEIRARVPGVYQRVVRLVANAFYTGPCPPKTPDQLPPPGSKAKPKPDYAGLGVILLEALTQREWVKEDILAEQLKVHPKVLRSALRYLEQQQLVTREHRKEGRRRQRAGAPDVSNSAIAGDAVEDAGDDVPKAFVHSYCCLDYARLIEVAQLRIALSRRHLKEQVQDKSPVQEYVCTSSGCGAKFNTLQAMDLIDMTDGLFHCQICGSVLAPLLDGRGAAGDDADRRDRKRKMKDLQARSEEQLKPLVAKLEEVRKAAAGPIPVPEFGSLAEWAQRQADLAARRAHQAGTGGRAGERAAARLQGIDEPIGIEIDLSGVEGGPARPAEEAAAKELPPWLRGQTHVPGSESARPATTGTGSGLVGSTSIGNNRSEDSADTAAAQQSQEEIAAAYKAAVLQQWQAQQAAAAATLLPPIKREDAGPGPAAKRAKMEGGWAGAQGPGSEPGPAAKDEEEDVDWEDAAPSNGVAAPHPAPAVAAAVGEDDDEEWEDA